MAKESISVKCYPTEEEINKTVKEYEAFGWELNESQRFQQGRDGFSYQGTNYFTTQQLLTFSRKKNEAWYDDVSAIEKQYRETIEKCGLLEKTKPTVNKKSPSHNIETVLIPLLFYFVIPALLILLILFLTDVLAYYWIFIPLGLGIIFSAVVIICEYFLKSEKKEIEKLLEHWHIEHDLEIEELRNQADDLAKSASAIISNNAK